MSNLDDELALFESEINTLVDDKPASNGVNGDPIAAKPPQSSAPTMAPRNVDAPPRPVMSAAAGRPFMPPQLSRPLAPVPMGMPFMGAPRLPGPGGMPSMFVPHQIRLPVHASHPTRPQAHTVSATIESAPSMYKPEQPSTSAPLEGPKVTALASDIDALSKKKSEPSGSSEPGKAKQDKKRKFIRTAGGQVWEDPSLAEWDSNDFRIFCGDLGNEVSDELLAKAFRKYPSFVKAKVIRDGRSNKSKGYGFVSFRNQEDYVRAIREMDGKYVGNRPIKLRKSQWKDRQIEVVKKKHKQKQKLGLMY